MKRLFKLCILALCLSGCAKQEAVPEQHVSLDSVRATVNTNKSVSTMLDEYKYNIRKIEKNLGTTELSSKINGKNQQYDKHWHMANRSRLPLPPPMAKLPSLPPPKRLNPPQIKPPSFSVRQRPMPQLPPRMANPLPPQLP